MIRITRFIALVAVLSVSGKALAEDVTILVAPGGSPAEAAATRQADGKKVFSERKLFKAFDLAASKLVGCGTCTVTIKVAAGQEVGKGGVGQWRFPEVIAPGGTLRILGGWDGRFTRRTPLTTPTVLVTSSPRSGPIVEFEGKKHSVRELVFSGFALDAAPGNAYDRETNSLLKGSSSSFPLLAFGYLTTERLVVADNVFMNAANAVGGPLIRPANQNSEVIVRNNLFLNNVFCWQVTGSASKFELARYLFEGNTFILNFPYNPDATTSNPGALEIGNKYSARSVEIRRNLFAYNVGGAIFAQYDDKLGPKLVIVDNLFWQNGALFEKTGGKGDGKGAIVGKFNRSAVHGSYTPAEAEDDFAWTMKGNVVQDPDVAVPVLEMEAVSYGPDRKPAAPREAGEGESVDFFGNKRSDITLDDDLDIGDYTAGGKIKNFAPRMPFHIETFPFPRSATASRYGARDARVK
jgi:hypothetical protein